VTTDGGPLAVFNWDDQPKQIALAASPRSRWQDFWTQRDLAFDRTGACAVALGPRDALLLHRTRI
jgi:hypothetical protein